MINVMTSPGHGGAPRSARRVAGRPAYPGRLTVTPPPAPPSKRERFGRSLAKAFYWRGWKTVGAVAASLVAILTAIAAITTLFISAKTLQANTRSQTSDRFVKAVDQLGNKDSLDVRLGGIYGLEQLARDSPSDHPAVFDVLTAFVRDQVPAGTGKCTDPTLHLGLPDQSPKAGPSEDVQAVVHAIARRDRKNDRKEKDETLSLSHTCLVAARWAGLQVPGIAMWGADLRYAILAVADLHEAFLADANLSRADLGRANLTGAKLVEANLTGAFLADANLSGAVLGGANLTGATLDGVNLSGIYYDGSTKWPNGFRPPPSRPKR
jgi:hypothetical protein